MMLIRDPQQLRICFQHICINFTISHSLFSSGISGFVQAHDWGICPKSSECGPMVIISQSNFGSLYLGMLVSVNQHHSELKYLSLISGVVILERRGWASIQNCVKRSCISLFGHLRKWYLVSLLLHDGQWFSLLWKSVFLSPNEFQL